MRFSHAIGPRAWLFGLLLLSTGSLIEAGPIYSVQMLGPLGSGAAAVSAINNSGLTVGFVTNTQGYQVPVAFSNGQASPLAGYGQANGVNDAATAIGTSYPSGTSNIPSVTEWANGQATKLNVSGYGVAINNAGQVAGGYNTSAGLLHAFVWSNGTLVDLGTLGGTWSSANSINAAGQVTGTSLTQTGAFNAFFSSGSGALVNLGTLGGTSSYGMAINNSGEVVGSAQTSHGFMNAFAGNGGNLQDLGTLGGSQSYAYGVNDAGVVVGSSWMTGNLVMHGFVDAGGVMIDLNQLLPVNSGWTIDGAYGINDSGDIVGTGTLNGQSYAVELAPPSALLLETPESAKTPEPASALLAGLGLCAVVSLRRLTGKGSVSL